MIFVQYISAYLKSICLLRTLVSVRNIESYGVCINKMVYVGYDGNPTPLKYFIPTKSSKHTLLIYPGASPSGEDHEKLHTLGIAFSRIGYEVYIPRIPPLKQLIITEKVNEWMAHFYSWFLDEKQIDSNNVSIIGISFGGSMVLKTSLVESVRRRSPRTLFSYGTYFHFKSVLDFLYSGKIEKDGKTINIATDNWALVGLIYNYLPKVDVGFSTNKLVATLRDYIQNKDKNVSEALKDLSNNERQIWDDIVDGNLSTEIKRIINVFQKECATEFENYSPKLWGSQVTNKVYILHGTYDNMVPFTESVKLANVLPNSVLHITDLYSHKEFSLGGKLIHIIKESIGLLRFLSKFIRDTIY